MPKVLNMAIVILALFVVPFLALMLMPSPGGRRPRNHPERCICGGSGEILVPYAPAFQDLYPCDVEWPE